MIGTTYTLEVRPNIPEKLGRLPELAEDLVYSWDRRIRGVFWRLDRDLWRACGNNPKLLLRRIAQGRLEEASENAEFLQAYEAAVAAFDSYQAMHRNAEIAAHFDPDANLVAYFCAEYGLHESFPIYSGGLGILAGDHCKAASDLSLPFVAIGLLYRQGYFTQTIDNQGRQQAHYHPANFDELPVSPALDANGHEVHVTVAVADRAVRLRVWRAKMGHIRIYLLDSDLAENSADDRAITHQLYGGDSNRRIQQEIALGIGGVRALRALGLQPTVWHINEGHAAFQILERIRERVAAGAEFDAALEWVASATVFTTHTPVAAGHDVFHHDQVRHHLHRQLAELRVEEGRLLALGADPYGAERFNMTALALRGSRFHNGVSRIHGEVAAQMESYIWPQVPPAENPIRHVTNGVHLSTFLSGQWLLTLQDRYRDWPDRLLDIHYWQIIDRIPDDDFVAIRERLKWELLKEVLERLRRQHRRNRVPEAIISRITRHVSESGTKTLLLGFARRFATYKRAALILSDPARLARILNNPERPAILIFAGKAHPTDYPGQEVIRQIYEYSMRPEFLGRLILLEGYDIQLARDLVQGCDVWLNTPEYPLEASGTSGMKAAANGAVNVSVLDGWWGEGYNGENGFAVMPAGSHHDARSRDADEAHQLLDILEHQVAPLYYGEHGEGYAPEWLHIARGSMKSIIPRFNAVRMVVDYVRDQYAPASRQHQRIAYPEDSAHRLAAWKRKVREKWPGVRVQMAAAPPQALYHGSLLPLRVQAFLNGLDPDDVTVECLIGRVDDAGSLNVEKAVSLGAAGVQGEAVMFHADLEPLTGLQQFRIRIFPSHPLLAHRFEMGAMVWA